MKKIFILLISLVALFSLNLNAETTTTQDSITYSQGWYDGWEEGWKSVKGDTYLIPTAPFPPTCPLDKEENYKTGFTLGVIAGAKKAKESY